MVAADSLHLGVTRARPVGPCGGASAPRADGVRSASRNRPCAASPSGDHYAHTACGNGAPPPGSTRRNEPATSPQAQPPPTLVSKKIVAPSTPPRYVVTTGQRGPTADRPMQDRPRPDGGQDTDST